MAVGDFNGDGRLDLTVANQSDNTVSVLLDTTATGAAVPSFSPQVTFAVGVDPNSVAVGDFNGDGKPDLVVANAGNLDTGNTVSVLLNTMSAGATVPAFAPQVTFAAGGGPNSVAAVDINGDGRPDLAVANYSDNTVSVLLNTTTPLTAVPSFAGQQTFAAGSFARLGGGGRLQRRRQARPRRRRLRRRHGVGAAEHDVGRGRPPLVRRPDHLRRRQRSPSPWRWATSTATAGPISSSPT